MSLRAPASERRHVDEYRKDSIESEARNRELVLVEKGECIQPVLRVKRPSRGHRITVQTKEIHIQGFLKAGKIHGVESDQPVDSYS